MSANPHNTSSGLPDDKSPVDKLPGVDVVESGFGNRGGRRRSSISAPSQIASHPGSHALGHEALQALLAFSALHEQIRQRRAREQNGDVDDDVWQLEHFVLDEVLQLVAERALTLTGADGVAIAMAEDDAIVCRAAAGTSFPSRAPGSTRIQDFPELACAPAASSVATIRNKIRG